MTMLVNKDCDVKLVLTPEISSSKKNMPLIDGIASFLDIYIETQGIYSAFFNGTCIEPFESVNSIIITGVNSIFISLESIYIKKDKEIDITVNYLGPVSSILNVTTFVTLSSSSIELVGITSGYGYFSKAIFYITFDNLGTTTLSASTDIDLETVLSEVLDVYILESMCLEKANNKCVKYVPLAKLTEGVCKCIELSYNIDVHCRCMQGYIESGGECKIQCFNVFTGSDVLGYYSEDYIHVYIIFSSSVIESSENDCSSRITLPNDLNSALIECKWKNSKAMLLAFSSVLDGDEFLVILDNSLTPVDEICETSMNPLNVTIFSAGLYSPTISLKGPSYVYLLCDKSDIIIENTLDRSDYEYIWVAKPSIYTLDELLDSIKGSKVEIPLSYFKEGSFYITCEVTSLIYNTYANETMEIMVTNEKHLRLGLNIPNDTSFFLKIQYIFKDS